ncbi:MAG: type I methionyl aminopeptidase [Candidatus Doudnabacteria bacterium]|nr:type I methionyl aminopeptidase [Candidatus Doudnabacteria bacterium]
MITSDPGEIKLLRTSGKVLAEVLQLVAGKVKPGISAAELDKLARQEILKRGAVPSFKNYKSHPQGTAFPASLCVSINNEVVHGIPREDKIFKEGDIVGLDLGVNFENYFTDAAITVPVGRVEAKYLNLINTARNCLNNALKVVSLGNFIGDIGHAIESTAKQQGFSVVRELVGHGVGKSVHEDPEIPCFGKPKTGPQLVLGMVLAIEPMVNEGGWKVIFDKDGWTVKTADGGYSAHFEHTVIVTDKGCEIFTNI